MNYLPRQFIAAWHKANKRLDALEKLFTSFTSDISTIKKHTETIAKNTEAKAQNREAEQKMLEVTAVIHAPEPIRFQEQPEDRYKRGREVTLLIVHIGTLAAVIYYACVTTSIWHTTQDQLTTMKDQQAAVLIVEDMAVEDSTSATRKGSFVIANHGQTAALDIWTPSTTGMIFLDPKQMWRNQAIEENIKNMSKGASGGFTLGAGQTSKPYTFDITIRDEDRPNDPSGPHSFFMVVVTYKDIFGREWVTTDCIHYGKYGRFAPCYGYRKHR